jgi:hypothetical protein
VTPFEFSVLAGVLVKARAVVSNAHHEQAFQAGNAAIAQETQYAQKYKEDWRRVKKRRRLGEEAEAPIRRHTFDARDSDYDYNPRRPMQRRKAVKLAGRVNYKAELKRLRQHDGSDVVVEVSRYALLRAAGLANKGENLRRLEQALDRLCRPVGGGREPSSPLLIAWKVADGKLVLQVSGEWLLPGYVQVPFPLPRNATTLALYLFVRAVKAERSGRSQISLATLCDRLGMASWGPTVANRTLNAALDGLNKLLAKLDRAALAKADITLPISCEIEPVGHGGSVWIVGNPDNTDYNELADVEEEEQKPVATRPKGRRTRVRLHKLKLKAPSERVRLPSKRVRLDEVVQEDSPEKKRLDYEFYKERVERMTRRRHEIEEVGSN